MFRYFATRSWHSQFHQALARGGNLSEIHDKCGHLKDYDLEPGEAADEAWYQAWSRLAHHLVSFAEGDARAGRRHSAARKYDRAAVYGLIAERVLRRSDPRKGREYDIALINFRRGAEHGESAIEWVQIPYQSQSLSALYVPAASACPAPLLVHLNGYDGTKETVYQRVRDNFRQAGISLLLLDQPGTGDAIRRRGLTLTPESNHAASAALDYASHRPEVDTDRVGVMGISFGSYHAARAAAFDPRFQCCIAWGGFWSATERPSMTAASYDRATVPESLPPFHRRWVTGQDTDEAAAAYLSQFSCESFMDRIRCPVLVLYGAEDQLVSRASADRQVAAATQAPRADLVVFSKETGGAEHCQNDNSLLAIDRIIDWVSDIFEIPAHDRAAPPASGHVPEGGNGVRLLR
ncbi:MAG: alpha/beta hydrolase family protein [Streptosporangiaceae bacterium]